MNKKITAKEPRFLGPQAILVHKVITQYNREVLVVGDSLHKSADDFARFLEEPFAIPVWVDGLKYVDDSVVFPHPYRVHDRQMVDLI